jgi:hypothetical protein
MSPKTARTAQVTDLYRVEKGFHEARSKLDSTVREKDKGEAVLSGGDTIRCLWGCRTRVVQAGQHHAYEGQG